MPADNTLERRLRSRLADLQSHGLLRTLRPPHGVDLSSNDYLALSRHPRIVDAFARGLAEEGAGSTGSRLLRGDREAFAEAERRFAVFKGTPRALFFSSGYLANIAVITSLTEASDVVFSDERNHASLIDGIRLARSERVVFPHNDVSALAQLLESTPCAGLRFVVVESLFSMDGDRAPLDRYVGLCRSNDAVLIVDEAHAVGVCGERGTGLLDECAAARMCVSINTAGKALGVGGAFVAGPETAIDYLAQRARPFVFSTAAPPAMAHAIMASLDLVGDEPDRRHRVRELSAYLRQCLSDAGVDTAEGDSHIVPIYIGDNDAAVSVAAALQADGFDVRAIRPPTVPAGTSRLRVSVNVLLDEPTIDRFVVRLSSVMKEAGVCAASS
jgi:8-amino-7-oxononanoate synthase